jgi:hypothetical protein
MRKFSQVWFSAGLISLSVALMIAAASGAAKVHVVTFGKPATVPWPAGSGEKITLLKIRPLVVDERIREYTLGTPHDVTDRLFVVRRMFRLNDSLPEEPAPHWQWERGGWLLVDRVTGKISAISLPEFDVFYSAASWYRDYVAYCGVSDDAKKTFAIVAQISRRRPVLKKPLSDDSATSDAPESACRAPSWQRDPVRVSFEPAGGAKQTFAIHGHAADLVNDNENEEEEEGTK